MALLDYLYFVGSPETKNAPHISGEQKKNREISNLLIFTYVGKHFVFLSQNKPNLKKSCDLICLKPTVFGFPQFRALEPCL